MGKLKSITYHYHEDMDYLHNKTAPIQCEVMVPTKTAKTIYDQALRILSKRLNKPIKKFDSSSHPLSEIEKIIYLPKILREEIKHSNIQIDFKDKSILSVSEIAEKFGFQFKDKTTIRQVILIEDACNVFGYKIEPSAKISQTPYKKDTKVCIYKNPYKNGCSETLYNSVSLFMDAGYMIALEDNELLPSEIACIENYVKKNFNLSPIGKYRFEKHFNQMYSESRHTKYS